MKKDNTKSIAVSQKSEPINSELKDSIENGRRKLIKMLIDMNTLDKGPPGFSYKENRRFLVILKELSPSAKKNIQFMFDQFMKGFFLELEGGDKVLVESSCLTCDIIEELNRHFKV